MFENTRNPIDKTENVKSLIRCYCNDKNECGGRDYCDTSTVCMTRNIKFFNKTTKREEFRLEYGCGEFGDFSFRNEIINFRDCLVRTNVTLDYKLVMKSSEHCCNHEDFCNRDLKPIESQWEYTSRKNDVDSDNHNQLPLLTLNAILVPIAVFLVLFLVVALIGLVYVLKRNKKLKEKFKVNSEVGSKTEIYPFIDGRQQANFKKKKNTNCMNIPRSIFRKNAQKASIYSKEVDVFNNSSSSDNSNEKPYIIGENLLKTASFAPLSDQHPASGTVTTTVSSANTSSNCITVSTTEEVRSSGNNSSSSSSFVDSGSGFGSPVVINRTISRDISLLECIGKGRYGQVWKSKWLEEFVAVKTFASNDSKSWENEINIYLTQCLRDENILGFIAADNVDRGIYTELWIITEYHENGALYDYLNNKTITPEQMIKMALSMSKGLAHLHRPIIGCKGKLPLAHCDLKTKNILVKKDLTCCIGDLGLALCGDVDGNLPSGAVDIRSGTKRYMAPEIISRTIDATSIGAYQKADMYSLSLVFWEMIRRCEFIDSESKKLINFDYQLPYYEYVDMNPDEKQMCETVCVKKLRPEMLAVWKSSDIDCIVEFSNLIEELWHENPDGRLKSLGVKKRLDKLKNSFNAIYEHL